MKYSDAELLSGLLTRDEWILKAYYTLYFKSIRRLVLSNTGNEEDARDLFQEVLLVLFQKVRQEHFKLTCSLGTFLYSISRYLWLKELGRRKWINININPADMEDFGDSDPDIQEISEYNERFRFYRSHFDKLSAACRKVLQLFTEGHSIAEITLIMGYRSEQHTRNRRYRCKLMLINGIRAELGHEITDNGDYKDN